MRTFYNKVILSALLVLTTSNAMASTLSPIDNHILSTYDTEPEDKRLGLRLMNTPVKLGDVYGVVASELAYKAAETVDRRTYFARLQRSYELSRENTALTPQAISAEYLKDIGIPPMFAGWYVVKILDTIPSAEEARDMFNPKATDLYGLTLMSPEGLRMTTVRGTDKKSLHNLLIDCGVVLNNGDIDKALTEIQKHTQEIIERKYFWSALSARIAANLIPNSVGEVMGSVKASIDASTSYLGTAAALSGFNQDLFVRHLRSKVTSCIKAVDEFIRRSHSPDHKHYVVGHSLGGILANAVVRAQEMMGGEAGTMAKRIHVISFNSTGTVQLIPTVIDVLGGGELGGQPATGAAPSVKINPALVGEDMERYREIYREEDIVGAYGTHIGDTVKLGARLIEESVVGGVVSTSTATNTSVKPTLSNTDPISDLPSAVAENNAAPGETAESSILTSFATALTSRASTAVRATKGFTFAAVGGVTNVAASVATSVTGIVKAPIQDLLEEHACSPLMIELLRAYAYQHVEVIKAQQAHIRTSLDASGAVAVLGNSIVPGGASGTESSY